MDGAAVFAFDKSGKNLLLVKRRDIPIWVIPGGGIEKGESPEEGAIRETKEESGFDIKIVRKVAEYTYKNRGKMAHIFEAEVIGGKAQLNREAKDIGFFTLDKLPELYHPFIPDWLTDLQKNQEGIIKREIVGITTKQAMGQFFKHPILVLRFLLTRVGIHINI